MKIKYLMKFFEGLPGLQANIYFNYPRDLFIEARYFFGKLRTLSNKQLVINRH